MSHCAKREEIVKEGRSWPGMGITVPPGTKLHVEKNFGRAGSKCTTREKLPSRHTP